MSFTLSTGNVVVANSSAAIISQTDTTATIRVTVSAYITDGWVYSTGVGAHITINGSTATRTVFGNGVGYYYAYEGAKTATYDVTINKTTASQNISWKAELYQYTDGTKQALKQTDTGTVAVKAKTSYSVTYNANGGTGAPAAQTKYYGTALTLSTTKPTRTGYTFSKWNTNASGTGTNYNAGASYSGNAALTLYAIWTANTYTITYNANGGTGAPGSQTKTHDVDLTLSSTKPTRTNYNFIGWATSATASTATYSAGGKFIANAATTLYAVWELAYTVPTITGYSVSRCTSNGTPNDFGTYAKVIFNWECCQITGQNNVSLVQIAYRVKGSTSAFTYITVSASGTKGSVNQVIGGGNLSTDNAYEIELIVVDTLKTSSNGTFIRRISIPMAKFILDFKAGGTGIAVGKPAELDNTFEVAKKTIFTGGGDLDVSSESSGRIIIGEPSGLHIAIDENEIQAKTNGTTAGSLLLNTVGGAVTAGGDLEVAGVTRMKGSASVTGETYHSASVYLSNTKRIGIANASGTYRSMVDMNANNQALFGYGGYSANEGQTYYDGNVVNIRSKGYIYMTSPSSGLTARVYGDNKTLWTGGHYMGPDHTADLSEAVSAQPNGIVLIWSQYSNGAVQNSSFVHHFIPKSHVKNNPGTSVFLTLTGIGAGVVGSKCVYVNDTTVTGHSINTAAGSDCSINYTNGFWVLRYVIGV